jgi:hypothetical protein
MERMAAVNALTRQQSLALSVACWHDLEGGADVFKAERKALLISSLLVKGQD